MVVVGTPRATTHSHLNKCTVLISQKILVQWKLLMTRDLFNETLHHALSESFLSQNATTIYLRKKFTRFFRINHYVLDIYYTLFEYIIVSLTIHFFFRKYNNDHI